MNLYLNLLVPVASMGIIAAIEWRSPRRRLLTRRLRRWPHNLSVFAATKILLRFLPKLFAPAAALLADYEHWGLLHWLPCPAWVAYILTFLLFDLSNYLLHVAFHWYPTLWRVHRVHHSDTDFDVTTALRTHPLDILLTNWAHLALAFLFGLPALAIIAFQVYSGIIGKFCHSNIKMPAKLDALLRLIMITPDMHRIHHSAWKEETDSNYGAVFPWWDWLFGTYRDQPVRGHENMVIGLEYFREEKDQHGHQLLLLPLRPNQSWQDFQAVTALETGESGR